VGFRGFIVSDGDGLQMLIQTHHVAANKPDAARLAIAAGVDYDLSDGSVYRTLIDQVKRGIVPQSEVDRAAGRMLAAKFRLGLFDNPYVDPRLRRSHHQQPRTPTTGVEGGAEDGRATEE